MIKIGITGSLSSGKTTASKFLSNRPENVQSINATIKALRENRKENWRQELITFQKYTTLLDKQREESMQNALPELYNLMYNSNR